jgi:hypothetical protein
MPLTPFQQAVCRIVAANRRRQGEAYIAGGVALNAWLETARLSRDVDLFHDTSEALEAAWEADRRAFIENGFSVEVLRQRPAYVEALIAQGDSQTLAQWTCDSAFRFFPLVEHPLLGLTLHPFDLATNKVLALVGRLEARDWVDTVECHARLQPLGYLAWAAGGKDAGWPAPAILEEAARSAHYGSEEIAALDYEGVPANAAGLAEEWRKALHDARQILDLLPAGENGKCVLMKDGHDLCRLSPAALAQAVGAGRLYYHAGSIRGAWPSFGPVPAARTR